MANTRAIKTRLKAVGNIKRITRTMQLIATARYQMMLSRAVGTQPYTEKISKLVGQLSRAGEQIDHPLLRVNEGANRSALLILTSNRGLCGGFNSGVLRTGLSQLAEREKAGEQVDVSIFGKKGDAYLKFLGHQPVMSNTTLPDWPPFADVEPVANQLIDSYCKKEIDSVHVAYSKFISVGRQDPTVLKLLPIEDAPTDEGADQSQQKNVEYEFSPDPERLLAALLPSYVRVRLYQCFTDSAVSEQVNRMVAMKAATDAASDMIKTLGRKYNRARQTQITMELLDIVGGANAIA